MKLTKTFEMNDKAYKTDSETLDVLRRAVASYKTSGSKDNSAVAAVMYLGLATGRIQEIK